MKKLLLLSSLFLAVPLSYSMDNGSLLPVDPVGSFEVTDLYTPKTAYTNNNSFFLTKNIKVDPSLVGLMNEEDNKKYNKDLSLLKETKEMVEGILSSKSFFQLLLDRECKDYQKLIQSLDDEIALVEDQDRVVSSGDKSTYIYQKGWNHPKPLFIPQLTHRGVFARSHMRLNDFEVLKAAREYPAVFTKPSMLQRATFEQVKTARE